MCLNVQHKPPGLNKKSPGQILSCSVLIYAHPGQPKNYEIIITLNKTTNTHCGSSSRKIVKFGQIAKASLNNIFLKHYEI